MEEGNRKIFFLSVLEEERKKKKNFVHPFNSKVNYLLENFNLLIVEIHERLYYWLEKGIGIKSLRFLIQHVFDDLDYLEPESYRFCELVRNLLVN